MTGRPLPSLLALTAVIWMSAPAPAAEVGVAPSTRKVLPETPFPAEVSIAVAAARGEWEGFQLVIEDDPWNVLMNLDGFGEFFARNGDGLLLYPGDHDGTASGKGSPEWLSLDGPVGSYRLKQIRDGLEDWEMFRLASDLGAEDFTRAQVERAYTRFGDFFMEDCAEPLYYCPDDQPWTLDEFVLLDARAQVAAKIQHLLHPDDYPDPEAEEEEPEGGPSDTEDPDGCRCAAGALSGAEG